VYAVVEVIFKYESSLYDKPFEYSCEDAKNVSKFSCREQVTRINACILSSDYHFFCLIGSVLTLPSVIVFFPTL